MTDDPKLAATELFSSTKSLTTFWEGDHSDSVFLSNLFQLNRIIRMPETNYCVFILPGSQAICLGQSVDKSVAQSRNGIRHRVRRADLRPIILCFWANGVICAAGNVVQQLKEAL